MPPPAGGAAAFPVPVARATVLMTGVDKAIRVDPGGAVDPGRDRLGRTQHPSTRIEVVPRLLDRVAQLPEERHGLAAQVVDRELQLAHRLEHPHQRPGPGR